MTTDDGFRVLLAIDGSSSAAVGTDLVEALDWPANTQVMVVQAIEIGAGLLVGPSPALSGAALGTLETELEDTARVTVDAAAERLRTRGLAAEAVVIRGRPASTIVDRSRQMRADLVVVGSRGRGTIASMLLGSVSAEVVEHAGVPVLVARRPALRRAILAWDGSACADRAAELLATWPTLHDVDVRVVSVADPGAPWWAGLPETGGSEAFRVYADAVDASRSEHDALAAAMAARLRDRGMRATAERRDGDAAAEVLKAATGFDADLIVMGTRGRTGLGRLLLGSVARNVVMHATASVLVVHDPGDQVEASA